MRHQDWQLMTIDDDKWLFTGQSFSMPLLKLSRWVHEIEILFFFHFCTVIMDTGDIVSDISTHILRKERNNLGTDRI